MTLYAIEDLDEAYAATRELLWPVELRRWAKLALVVFFVGGLGGMNPLQFGGNSANVEAAPLPELPDGVPTFDDSVLWIIATIIAAIVVIALLFLLIGSIMEFVFVASLRQEEVHLRQYWSHHWRRGLRLFGFRVLLNILTFGIIGLLLLAVVYPILIGSGGFSFGLLFVVIPVIFIVTLISALTSGFTTMFIVPIMIIEDISLLAAWRRLWPTMTGQWKQYLVYAVISFVLQIAGGIAAGIVTMIGALIVAIPLGIIGAIGAGLLAVSTIFGGILIAVAVLLFAIVLLGLIFFTAVPVQTYLRYFALLVLGDTNEDFDIISERRQLIRTDSSG